MRPLTADDEAILRRLAERHGFLASRGPHTGEGSTTRLIEALLSGEVITLALAPADRRRLVEWLDTQTPPAGRLTTILGSLATQVRSTLPPAQPSKSMSKKETTARSPRTTPRLTTVEAAQRLGLSTARVQEMARNGEIGRKDEGRWTFSATEIARCKEERDHRDLFFSPRYPQPTRKQTRQRPKKRSPSRRSGRLTVDDLAAATFLDQLLAHERFLDQAATLPFPAPPRIETTIHTCLRCGQNLLFLIFGDQATDAEGLAAYGQLMHDPITAHGLPAYVLSPPYGDPHNEETPSLLCQVWPQIGETQVVTPAEWNHLLAAWSSTHCGTTPHRGD